MTDEELARLIAMDTLGLLAVKPKRSPQSSAEARVLKKFGVIVSFVESHGAPPSRLADDLEERRLFESLAAIRRKPTWVELLRPFDEHGVLATERTPDAEAAPLPLREPTTVEDILNDPLLATDSEDIRSLFALRHVTARSEAAQPEYVAQRHPCRDFASFQSSLEACQEDLAQGRRRLLPFVKQQRIEVGKFFTLRGVLLMVSAVEEASGHKVSKSRDRSPTANARLRCIFENGTESDMLERSLEASLYKDGCRVTELSEDLLKHLMVTADDSTSGHIYVLRSLSQAPDIVSVPNLYKIGLARQSIEQRIRNAASEPTYLLAPVALVATFECFNVKLPKVERLLHRFFDAATVKVQVRDHAGNYTTPKEWFSVPLEVIEAAVDLLISGEIVSHRYNADTKQIERA